MINRAALPVFAQGLPEPPGTLSTEATDHSRSDTGLYGQFSAMTLRERKIECSGHSESVCRSSQGEANESLSLQCWHRYPHEPEVVDIYSYITNGANEKIAELVEHGHDLNKSGDCDEPPLFYALNFGSLETVLLLLKLGADPNLYRFRPRFTSLSSGDYSLRETDKLSRLVLLLSYGANLRDDYQAFGDVLEDHRILRLAVYFFWEKYCEAHAGHTPRPESVAELNQLVFALPVLQITAYVSLFNDYPERLNQPAESLPDNLRDFFKFIGSL